MSTLLSLSLCVCLAGGVAPSDAADAAPDEAAVTATCTGKIRDGIVAIGGETTGTTLTCDGVTWELRLATEADRAFAHANNKRTVTVTGRLQTRDAVESGDRWIIDVTELRRPEAAAAAVGSKLTITGTIRPAAPPCDAAASGTPGYTIQSGNQTWPLDLTSDASLRSAAESLVAQPATLTATLAPAAKAARTCAPGVLRVTAVVGVENATTF